MPKLKLTIVLGALCINGAGAEPIKRPMSKPDENGACFYLLTEREAERQKQEFGDACVYQPRGAAGCLPETCRASEQPKAPEPIRP